MGKLKKEVMNKILVVALVAVVGLGAYIAIDSREKEPQFDNTVVFQKILNVSHLSTLETTYSGIAAVTNPKDFQDVQYYVSYDATITAGIDFNQVVVSLDEVGKKLRVELPDSKITETNVDITSLDYLFYDNKYNASGVSADAYKACVDDMAISTLELTAVRNLARDNAVNVIKSLTLPFVEQLGKEYTLEIV